MLKYSPKSSAIFAVLLCVTFFGLALATPSFAEVKNCDEACLQAESSDQAACVAKCEEFVAKVGETPVGGPACYFNIVFTCSETTLIKLPIDVLIDCVAEIVEGKLSTRCLNEGFCDAGKTCEESICDCYAKGNDSKKCNKNWNNLCKGK